MSSFMVENKTINRIVDFVYWNTLIDKSRIREEFRKYGVDLDKSNDAELNKQLENFGKMLICLNALGVKARYEDGFNADECVKEYKYFDVPSEERGIHQVLMSLNCLLYQCSEGDVDKNPLFESLESLKTIIQNNIISEIPEYNKAYWG